MSTVESCRPVGRLAAVPVAPPADHLVVVPLEAAPPRPAVPVDAAVWLAVGALVPTVERRRRQAGRRRRDDRRVLEGILHVLATGIAWRELPPELGCGSGVTCWRRLREWVDGGAWAAIEDALHPLLGPDADVDWDRAWGGTPRPLPDDASSTPVTAVVPDPGATFAAIDRRRAWAGPPVV